MQLGSIVIASFHSPKEKVWGQLVDLTPAGATIFGLDLNFFDGWLNQVGSENERSLMTTFYPLIRTERITLDEPEGTIPSLAQRLTQKCGTPAQDYLAKMITDKK